MGTRLHNYMINTENLKFGHDHIEIFTNLEIEPIPVLESGEVNMGYLSVRGCIQLRFDKGMSIVVKENLNVVKKRYMECPWHNIERNR